MDGIAITPGKFYSQRSNYERGVAVGGRGINGDKMVFNFWDEVFEFPTMTVWPHMKFNGYFYVANIDDLRKLEAEAASG